MSKTVEIELEFESGLTNSAVESMVSSGFPEADVVSVHAFDTPAVEQEPVDGEIVNTQWADWRTFLADVETDDGTIREYYTFDSAEELDKEENAE